MESHEVETVEDLQKYFMTQHENFFTAEELYDICLAINNVPRVKLKRNAITKRNNRIKHEYKHLLAVHGCDQAVVMLRQKYNLTFNTIRNVLYGKRKE